MNYKIFFMTTIFAVHCAQASVVHRLSGMRKIANPIVSGARSYCGSFEGMLARVTKYKPCDLSLADRGRIMSYSSFLDDLDTLPEAAVYALLSEQRRYDEIGYVDQDAQYNADTVLTYSGISPEKLATIYNKLKPQVDKMDRPWRSHYSANTAWLQNAEKTKSEMWAKDQYDQGYRKCLEKIIMNLFQQDYMTLKEIAGVTKTPEHVVKKLYNNYVDMHRL